MQRLGGDDTLWLVNYKFDRVNADSCLLKLKFYDYDQTGYEADFGKQLYASFKKIQSTDASVSYGNDTTLSDLTTDEFAYNFPEGLYYIEFSVKKIANNSDKKICHVMFFNKSIEFEIDTVKPYSDGDCISPVHGADTCIFKLKGHELNPKGTKYEMKGNLSDEDILIDKEKLNGREDMFYVIFNGPTGYNDLFLNVTGSWINPVSRKTTYAVKQLEVPIRKYDAPRLEKIFGYDTTKMGELIGCVGSSLGDLTYNEDANKKYMDFLMTPDFKTKELFEIEYYKKDKMEDSWDRIPDSDKASYINDSTNFIFTQAGIYRIKMKVENYCGENILDTEIETTEDGQHRTGRVIKVFRNDVKNLQFKNPWLCLSGDTVLVIKDYAYRLEWEPQPVYEVSVSRKIKNLAGEDSLVLITEEEQGKYYELLPVQFSEKDPVTLHYDSATVKCVFRQKGHYLLKLLKTTTQCGMVMDSVLVRVGEEPVVAEGFLDHSGGEDIGSLNTYGFCGPYTYSIPSTIDADSNYAEINQYEWTFGKATHATTYTDAYPEIDGGHEVIFDSLVNKPSYITLRVGNRCGWSEKDSVMFYTYKKPNVALWRDSLPENDTLCAGRSYNYYFKGDFPDHFRIEAGGMIINNDSVVPAYWDNPGEVDEKYKIVNTDDPTASCSQTISDPLYMLAPPEFHVMDTVDFCGSTTEIQTHALLIMGNPEFKNLEWKPVDPTNFNFGTGDHFPDGFDESKKQSFPSFPVNWDDAILGYYVSSGGDYYLAPDGRKKGCFDEGEIVLRRHAVPQLVIDHSQQLEKCENDLFPVADMITSTKEDALHLEININGQKYFSSDEGSWDIPDYTCPLDQDTLTIIYRATQLHTYMGQDGCDLADSVKVHVLHPRIAFTKVKDTVYTGSVYHFERLRNYLDTANVKNLTWSVVNGNGTIIAEAGGNPDDLFNRTYDFTGDGKNARVTFKLSGTSPCGDKEASVEVLYPLARLDGGEAYICDDAEGYPLWKGGEINTAFVTGAFVDTASLQWTIVSGTELGSITGEHSAARFLPNDKGGRGEVRIHCIVQPLTGESAMEADLILHLSRRPRITFTRDFPDEFVLGGNDSLIFPEVVSFDNYAGTPSLTAFGDGTFGGNEYYLPAYTGHAIYHDSVYIMLTVKDEDKLACGERVCDTLPLLVYPNPAVTMDADTLKMCMGDEITLGEIHRGKFTVECDYSAYSAEWSARSGCTDCFINPSAGTVVYRPSGAGYETVILTVSTDQEITNYRGITRKLSASDSLTVKAHGKPEFSISRHRDTICYGTEQVDITGIDVSTLSGDPVRFHKGYGLLEETPPMPGRYRLSVLTDSAKIYVTAIQEGCDNWIDVKDSITILRLPALEAALARTSDSVCSNRELYIMVASANTNRFSWSTKSGGMIAEQGTFAARYTPVDGIMQDTVVVTALPMLENCPDQKMLEEVVKVVKMPELVLGNDTICSDAEEYTLQLETSELISHIEWSSASGGNFKDGANEILHPVYLISEADRLAGKVVLNARIELRDPCGDIFPVERSMELTLLTVPTLSFDPEKAVVCQGDSLLLDFVTFSSGVQAWNWTTAQGHYNNPAVAAPYFVPEENNGVVVLKVTFTGSNSGTHACVAEEVPVEVNVREAVLPALIASDTVCQYADVVFTTDADAMQYTWTVNENEVSAEKDMIWQFDVTGEQPVGLEVTYANTCKRSVSDTLIVNPAISAAFKADSAIVGVGKKTGFINETVGVTGQRWYVNETDLGHKTDFEHIFIAAGDYEVKLKVRNVYGCVDSTSQPVKVLDRPVADFEVTLDRPCDGAVATFQNLSVGDPQYCSYRWILGTDIASVDTTGIVPVGDVVYRASELQDTMYYVSLVVENAAGASIASREVKVLSPVKPNLVPVEGVSQCGSFERTFFNKTTGSADWYRIDWGDGTDTTFTELTARQMLHTYVNLTDETRWDTVRIFAGNVCTQIDSMKFPVEIYPNPAKAVVHTNLTENCAPFEVTFSNKSIGFEDSATTLWDFGEGNPMEENNGQTVTHVYNQPGEYRVRMMMYDGCNKDIDSSVIIRVKGINDKLAFTVVQDLQCSGQAVTFRINPDIRDLFYDFQWNFNYAGNPAAWDISTRNDTVVTRKWNTPGNYQIALKAKSVGDQCQVAPFYKTVDVKLSPIADFRVSLNGEGQYDPSEEINRCSPLDVEFKSLGNAASDMVDWSYGDGGTADGFTPLRHTYTAAGTYLMKMTVTAENGCVDTLSRPVIVRNSPEALFVNKAGNLFCNGDQVRLEPENLSNDREGVNYTWTYRKPGEAGFIPLDDSADPQPVVLEPGTVGKVVVKLLATREGCESMATDTLLASAPLDISDFNISRERMCKGEETDFRIVTNGSDQVSWDLGDHSPLKDTTDFTYVYDEVGQYDVKLLVTDAFGCQEEMGRTVYVYPIPEADFDYEEDWGVYGEPELPADIDISKLPQVKNGGIRFRNYSSVQSVGFATGELLYEWDFGDGSPVDGHADPGHRFPNNGQYETRLTVRTAEQGCRDSAYTVITIDAVKGLFFPNAFAPSAGIEENPGVALFQPKGVGLLTYKIKVYDESGTCVWISDKLNDGRPAEGWDGTFNGSPLPKGLYKWEASAVFIDGSVWTGEDGKTQGVVMLIR